MEVRLGADRIDWVLQASYERVLLTVTGPDGAVYRQGFQGGQPPAFDLAQGGAALPDGVYTWELRLVPQIDAALRQRSGTQTVEKARPAVSLQSGQFVIRGGAMEAAEDEARPAAAASTSSSTSTDKDQAVFDDLIVDGRVCAGFDCAAGMPFVDEELSLTELNTGLYFWDTSAGGGGFPFHDWGVYTGFEGFENFSVYNFWDVTTRPFTIEGSSPTGSLWVDNTGRVGMGTTAPLWDLHITNFDTPGLLLEQDASIFPPRSWLLRGNELGFNVTDASAGTSPLIIRPGAPSSSLSVAANGWVGLGTTAPGGQLQIFGGATSDVFAGMGPDIVSGPGFNFGYAGTSFGRGAGFFNVRPDAFAASPNPSLRFATSNVQRMILDNQGFLGIGVADPVHPIQMASGAHVTAGGTWVSVSTREAKQDVAQLTAGEALEALAGLDPVKYAYKVDPAERHVGFIAEEVPDLVATPDRKGLSALDIVAVLTKVVQEQQRTIERLEARVAELEEE